MWLFLMVVWKLSVLFAIFFDERERMALMYMMEYEKIMRLRAAIQVLRLEGGAASYSWPNPDSDGGAGEDYRVRIGLPKPELRCKGKELRLCTISELRFDDIEIEGGTVRENLKWGRTDEIGHSLDGSECKYTKGETVKKFKYHSRWVDRSNEDEDRRVKENLRTTNLFVEVEGIQGPVDKIRLTNRADGGIEHRIDGGFIALINISKLAEIAREEPTQEDVDEAIELSYIRYDAAVPAVDDAATMVHDD